MPQKILSIRIDGELVKAAEGQTILQAARSSSKYIPTLCWLEGLDAVGACRLCVVEVSGVGRLLPACTTPVQDGMAVTTNSPKLQRYRRLILELLFVERNHVCAVCVSNGNCELQALAISLGVTSVRFPYNYPKLQVDMSHERFVLDHNRCVLCTRCVRVCDRPRRRARLGRHLARHQLAAGQRPEPALGPVRELHQLRQMRPGLPHRSPGRKGQRRGGNGQAPRKHRSPGPPERSPAMSVSTIQTPAPARKIKLATVWLDGCAGCHMSLLDIDEALLLVAQKADIVYGPLVDAQEFPEGVDVTLVEGAVSSHEDLRLLHQGPLAHQAAGRRSATAPSPATCRRCATPSPSRPCCSASTWMACSSRRAVPGEGVPGLLKHARPMHDFVKVDLHIPGCPPARQGYLRGDCRPARRQETRPREQGEVRMKKLNTPTWPHAGMRWGFAVPRPRFWAAWTALPVTGFPLEAATKR